ncbi:MAG: alpha/beta hydrolase [Lysobacter sp.]|nr:alpha/beta hydrolase [Lysobacter sp.]
MALAGLLAGCQSAGFGIANLGASAPVASVVYDPRHGLALDVYRPVGTTTGPVPVVVFLYGGNWKQGHRSQYRFVGHRLAQQGVLAIVADYRTFPRTTFPGFVEDGARAVAWARAHAAEHGGDPRRLFVAGHSAGAQIAALIGTDACYLAPHGLRPRDLAGVIGFSGPYDFEITGYEDVFGPETQWPRAQAVNFVDGDEPPFLLVHGTADMTVEAKDSRELAVKLRSAGVETTLVWLPGAGHLAPLVAMRAPSRQPALMPAIRAFMNLPAKP